MWFLPDRSLMRELTAKLDALDKSQAIIEFEMDGTIITANENFLSVMGYSLEEVRGKHHSIFVDQQYKESSDYRSFWSRLNQGKFQSAQYKRLGKGGKEVWIEASYNPILDLKGKPYKVIKFATDITKQRIKDNEYLAKLDAIGKSQAIIEFEMDGTIITANENFLSAMGYSLEEIRGKHHSIFVDQQFKESSDYRAFWATLNKGEFQAAQYKRLGKGGKEVWIEASYNPIFDLKDKPYKVVKFATDVTHRKAAIRDISVKINELVSTMSSSATEMNATAETLAAAAEETSVQSVAVATATEELTKSVQEISRQLAESVAVVNSAVTETNNSERMVSGLIQAAGKIGSVSDVVAEIASQTNLLALNATIEAARAGEAGKGFSVVASEVKSLATQTGKATGEIGQQVQGIQASSQETGDAIKRISQVIAKVSQISTSISGAVEEQSAATNEVAMNISGVKKAAEETGRSSTNLLTVSRDISERASELNKEFALFVKSL